MRLPSGTLAVFLAAAFSTAALAQPQVAAQSWPARPLRVIVPERAGSAPDAAARVICERLSQVLREPVRVEDRGDDETAGAQAAARAAPDGYTLFFAPAQALVIEPYISSLVPYSPEDDFASVAMVGLSPFVVAVNPELNVKSLADLVALAREAPGRLAYASQGLLTLPGMLGEMLRVRTGIELMPVPYRSGQGVGDTISGRTHLTIQGIAAIAAAVHSGQLRAIAVSSARRLPGLKDVPTLSETFPGFEFNDWFAIVAPAGTPGGAIQRLNLEMNSLLLDPDIEQRLRALGIFTQGTSAPDQVDAFLASERASWRQTVRELRIEP
ncbi:MAG TPA: tripartite tricarboxylate transporter substrate-binding protein [Burkholderiales bacterium]|nr:tripartite tricarboxylate transporter substrate-binding protein [Burkholderiales bacterium]